MIQMDKTDKLYTYLSGLGVEDIEKELGYKVKVITKES